MPPLRENQQSQQNQRKQPEAPADAIPVVTTDKLSNSFSGGGSQQHVLRNLDLAVDEGSFTVIMGPSGAGKSTLLYALSGLDRPTLGTVRLGGTRLTELKEDALARFRRGHCLSASTCPSGTGARCPPCCRAVRRSAWPSPGP